MAPRAVVDGSLNQPGMAATDNAANQGTPPDPTGAVGPSHYVEFVNSSVAIYSKSTLAMVGSEVTLDNFIGRPGDNVFDPQIQFDPVANRWFYLADDCTTADCSTNNFLAYGFSKSADPTGGWCPYFVRSDDGVNGFFDDYPKLGHNDTHLIFGTNVFDLVSFVSARIWTVPKPAAGTIATCPSPGTADYWSGAAAAPVKNGNLATAPLMTSNGQFGFTPVPANTQDASANGYVVAAGDPPGGTKIMAWHVDSSGALHADGNMTVGSFDIPAYVPQPGSTDVLDSSDTRLTQAVAHADPDASGAEAVWTQHTIRAGNRSVDRWYELIPSTLTTRQEGEIAAAPNFVFNGAITPTLAGNEAVIQYNVGGNVLAEIRASSRTSSTALGTMVNEATLGTSTDADQDFSCHSVDPTSPSCRWGDYAGITPDPDLCVHHRAWGTNQLLGAPNGSDPHWTTRNFALIPAAEVTACFSATPSPAFTGKQVDFDASGSTDATGAAGVDSYEWDLDGDGTFDGPPSATPTASHTYTQAGIVSVKLRVTAGAVTDTIRVPLTVRSSAPTAAFTAAPQNVTRTQVVSFDGSASTDSETPGGIKTYAWDFGDGTTTQTSTPTITHAYSTVGSFNAKLVVTDLDDNLDSGPAIRTITVRNVAPTAALSFSPSAPLVGQEVGFSAAGSADPDGAVADYKWDLDGDGVFELDTGTRDSATRTYSTPGTFAIAVRVQDSDGAFTIARSSVTVAQAATSVVTPPAITQPVTQPAAEAPLKLVLGFRKTAKLAKVLKAGLGGSVNCGKACVVKLTVTIAKKLARKLKTKTIVARATVRPATAGPKSVKLVLTRAARKALGRAPSLTVTITGTATDSARHSSSAKLAVRVRR
ncbi:MAG: PKD domain-containing protein [Thermoleophilaceae bacterium]